jgi:hypothetical protein
LFARPDKRGFCGVRKRCACMLMMVMCCHDADVGVGMRRVNHCAIKV